MSSLKHCRVAVSGANGFLGSALVRRLVADGADVVCIVRPNADHWRLADILHEISLLQIDVGSDELITLLPREFPSTTHIFHLAATGLRTLPGGLSVADEIRRTNVLGTLHLLEAAMRLNLQRFVYAGSCFEYGAGTNLGETAILKPAGTYATSKANAGMLVSGYAQRYQLPTVWLRLFTAYGPFESEHRLVPHLFLSGLRSRPALLSRGLQERDFVYVDDVVGALIAGATNPRGAGGIFNVCTGVGTSVQSLAEQAARHMPAIDIQLGAIGYKDPAIDCCVGDPSLAAAELGWVARTTLSQGLSLSSDWFAQHIDLYERRTLSA